MSADTKVAEELISHRQVFPNDANPAGIMFGGRIMEMMDSSAGMAADRYSNTVGAVTASVEALTFQLPVHVGDMLQIVSKVVCTGRTSMVIRVHVYRFDKGMDPGVLCNTAHYIFVAMDADRRPTSVPPLQVTTAADKQAWDVAQAVREQSLRVKAQIAEEC